MRLNVKPLKSVVNINHFAYANEVYVSGFEGEVESTQVFFQLVDLDQNLRYIPSSGSTLSVKFSALEEDDEVEILASQPFADDRSIFMVSVPDGEKLHSGNLIFTFTEAGNVKTFVLKNGLVVEYADQGGC